MSLSNIQKQLLEVDSSNEMRAAIAKGVFYVDAVPCLCSGYSIGSYEGELPAVMATKAEAENSQREIADDWLKQIKDGERDADDEWESDILECRWDGISENMSLYDGDMEVYKGSWKELAGLA